MKLCLLLLSSRVSSLLIVISREDLPVQDQHLPDLLHDDVVVTHQEEERGVRVVEPVQQHLRHLPLLLPYQPGKNQLFMLEKIWNFVV